MSEKIGKYDIVERIGRGGMGTVFKAKDPRLNRYVALKVISPDIEITDDLRTRFISEAQACAGLRHPNIVTIYDVGEEGERVFIVMELLDGQELKRLIADRAELDIEDKVWVMIQLCDALHYAHTQGIIHRDVKPGNVVVQRDGSVKVIDFGIAKMAQSASATRTGLIMGTIRYMSPEQVRGRADARSDQYSLGAVCYEMLALRPPFLGDDPIALLEQLRTEKVPHLCDLDETIPSDLAAIVERAICRDAAERFPDLDEMKNELDEVRRRLRGEADTLRRSLGPRLAELRELQAAYAERVGADLSDEIPPGSERSMRLQTLQKWDARIEERLGELRHKIERAAKLNPDVDRAGKLLREGRVAEVIALCEAVVNELPEHTQANRLLDEARERDAEQRRQVLAKKLLDDARAALKEGDSDLCLSILEQAAEISTSGELLATIESMRSSAVSQREERARLLREAEQARQDATAAGARAARVAPRKEAAAAWDAAERSAGDGEKALLENRLADALAAFGAAIAGYARFEDEVAEARRRKQQEAEEAERAERLRQEEEARLAEQQRREAEQRIREAEEKEAEERRQRIAAEEREAEERRKRREIEEREAEERRRKLEAEEKDAEERRRKLELEEKQAEERRRKRELEEKQAEERRRKREAEEKEADLRKREAEAKEAERRKREAEAKEAQRVKREAEAKEAARRKAEADARKAEADAKQRRDAEAKEAEKRKRAAQAEAGDATVLHSPGVGPDDRTVVREIPVRAAGPAAAQAPPIWKNPIAVGAGAVVAIGVIAVMMFSGHEAPETPQPKAAVESPVDAAKKEAELEAARKAEARVKDAEAARAQAEAARAQAEAEAARLKAQADAQAQAQAQAEKARIEAAQRAEQEARDAARDEAKKRAEQDRLDAQRADKERKDREEAARKNEHEASGMSEATSARDDMASAKSAASKANASVYAADVIARAAGSEEAAAAAFKRSDYPQAAKLYASAASDYRSAAKRAGEKATSLEKDLDQAVEEAGLKRREALAAGASRLATDLFRQGASKQEEVSSLTRSGNLPGAIAASRAALRLFEQAQREAEAQNAKVEPARPVQPVKPAKPGFTPSF